MKKQQLQLVSKLYDAALKPDVWVETLDQLAGEVGAKASALLVLETQSTYDYSISKTSSLFPTATIAEYEEKYSIHEQAHFERVASSKDQEIVYDADYLEDASKFRCRPDVAWLESKHGIFERFAVRLNEEKAWFDCITFQYDSSRGNISSSEKQALRLYLPHIAKVTDLSRAFTILRNKYAAVLSVLDRLLLGMIIVSPSGEIILKNETANNILDSCVDLSASASNKLQIRDQEAHSKFVNAIEKASHVISAREEGCSTVLQIPNVNNQDAIIVDIAPIRDTNMEIGSGLQGALITIVDPNYDHSASMKGVRELYKLSPGENAIASHLVDGRSYSEIADIRGVSFETVKSQVNSVFLKTNTNSRSKLLTKLLKINIPVK